MSANDFLIIRYDADAIGDEWSVEVTETARGAFSILTDFELKVVAAELSLLVQKSVELPPSPKL